jgi:hypothetical protein
MNLLEDGAQWLADQMEESVSSPVVYVRGSLECPLNASLGKTQFEVTDQAGMLQNVESHDFILRASEMLFDGLPFVPKAYDSVLIVRGGVTHKYVVVQYGSMIDSTEQVYRWCDPYGKQLRVHTRYEGVIE